MTYSQDFNSLFPTSGKHDAEAAKLGNCYCKACTVEYKRLQNEAVADFRQRARFSYKLGTVRHCYGNLADAKAHQQANNVHVPIWDAVNQEHINW